MKTLVKIIVALYIILAILNTLIGPWLMEKNMGAITEYLAEKNDGDITLYEYDKTPCDGKKFSIDNDMILLENKRRGILHLLYSISRYSLDDYKEYLSRRVGNIHKKETSPTHKEIKLYKAGSSFLIKKYYRYEVKNYFNHSEGGYFLIQTADNHLAWIYDFDFDPIKCKATVDNDYSKKDDSYYKNSTRKLVPYIKPEKGFSDKDELYNITKDYYKKENEKIDKIYNEAIKEYEQLK